MNENRKMHLPEKGIGDMEEVLDGKIQDSRFES